MQEGITLTFASENVKDQTAKGLEGGHNGKPTSVTVDPGGPGAQVFFERRSGVGPLPAGTLLRAVTGGGGGRGQPDERDPQAVLADVRNGFISVEAARDLYRVVCSAPPEPVLDEAATASLRGH